MFTVVQVQSYLEHSAALWSLLCVLLFSGQSHVEGSGLLNVMADALSASTIAGPSQQLVVQDLYVAVAAVLTYLSASPTVRPSLEQSLTLLASILDLPYQGSTDLRLGVLGFVKALVESHPVPRKVRL
jgi:hypothetical protein